MGCCGGAVPKENLVDSEVVTFICVKRKYTCTFIKLGFTNTGRLHLPTVTTKNKYKNVFLERDKVLLQSSFSE